MLINVTLTFLVELGHDQVACTQQEKSWLQEESICTRMLCVCGTMEQVDFQFKVEIANTKLVRFL